MESKVIIPEEWIKGYVDQLIKIAGELERDSPMQLALLIRADHVMDMVKAYRENKK